MDDLVYGRNAVIELLTSGKTINKLLIQEGETHGSIKKVISIAREKNVVIVKVNRSKLDELTNKANHQGVIAFTTPYEYFEIDDILKRAYDKNEKPLIVILDKIEDPHNLGAIIRTAECMGAHGVVIPKRRAVAINSTVLKVAAGALEHMAVARVNNINDVIEDLKEKGLWIIATDADAKTTVEQADLKDSIAIVIGSEGEGISSLTKKKCDLIVKIPMKGQITSLNASVSCAMVLYESICQRGV